MLELPESANKYGSIVEDELNDVDGETFEESALDEDGELQVERDGQFASVGET